ncbi:MAG: GNAT family N-acetyltransferase [Cyanobacteria bacterium]|nr:GNAT family N-acetyltransferase [Cyanobacteriota bacterium]
MSRFRVRPAVYADRDALLAGALAMALETEQRELNHEQVLAGITRVLNDHAEHPAHGRYWVAVNVDEEEVEITGQITGMCLLTQEWSDWHNTWYGWIQSVYVWPQYRGRGIWRELLKQLKGHARQHGFAWLRLYVEKENIAAQAVYQQMGFKKSHYQLWETGL